jgi:predicted outer membrane repeat protein
MKKFLLLIFVFILFNSLFARYLDIPVTRDPNSDGNYGDLKKYTSDQLNEPSYFREISREYSNSREEGGVLIVVEQNLYPQIESAINTYIADLIEEDYDVFLLEFSGNLAFDLKVQLMIYCQQQEITGVILIGDLPYAVFEMFEDFNNNGIWDPDESWVEFPCDLYYSDIDGSWVDNDNNGAFEEHIGEVHPEIFIGRIKAENMTLLNETESELINHYFARNHLYRNGFINFPSTALAYIDDDWSYWGPEYQTALELLFEDTTLINEINETTAQDYRDAQLQEDYEFIHIHVHSGPEAHHFSENNGNNWNLVTNGQLATIQPKAFFYNLFCCSISRFTVPNNIGGMYIYGNESCFATLGSTKTGAMLFFEDFYGPLSEDENLGNAFRLWWELNVDASEDWMWERSWFYGMIIQGDPTLKLQHEYDTVINIPADYPTIQAGINASEDGDVVLVQPGIYLEDEVNFNGKNITLGSLFLATQDSTYISQTVISGMYESGIVFENGEDSTAFLTGFTISNCCGEGIYCNNSSPTLENLIIEYNQGGIICENNSQPTLNHLTIRNNEYLGGIKCSNSNLTIRNSLIINNSSTEYGGGFRCNNSNPILENVILANNQSSWGGGFYCSSNSNPIFTNVSIIGNYATFRGGGLYCRQNCNPILQSVIMFGNTASDNGGSILCADNSNPILINCILWNNLPQEIYFSDGFPTLNSITISNSDVQGGETGIVINNSGSVSWMNGNIDADPLFINSAETDFHLQDTSPCIGAGIDEIEIAGTWYYAPVFDLEGNSRPNPEGSMPDMGVFENILGEPLVGISNNQLPKTNNQLTNYPNPFNPSTTISFQVNTEITENTKLVIYNLKGQKIKTYPIILSEVEGQSSIVWDGADQSGKSVTSGIYFAKLKSGKFEQTRKMLLMK